MFAPLDLLHVSNFDGIVLIPDFGFGTFLVAWGASKEKRRLVRFF